MKATFTYTKTKARAAMAVLVLFLAFVMVPVAATSSSATPDNPPEPPIPPIVSCNVNAENPVMVQCSVAGSIIFSQVLTLPTITLPPLPGVTRTVTVPGPTVTQPAPPQATRTVTDTETVVGPTNTVTDRATSFVTRTASPSAAPTRTVTAEPTATPTATVTRQVDASDATVTPVEQSSDSNDGIFNIPETTAGKVAFAGVSLAILLGLMILALWLGYILGYKNSEKENLGFIQAMSDKILIKR